jgi:hypothetical protein
VPGVFFHEPYGDIVGRDVRAGGKAVLALQPCPIAPRTESLQAGLAELERERPDAFHTVAKPARIDAIRDKALQSIVPLFATQRSAVEAAR